MNEFGVRTKIYFGDALPKLAEKMHRVYVVTDRFMAESGKVSYVTDRLAAAGAEYAVFSEIDGEPDISVVSSGVQNLNRFARGSAAGCDAVISLGGGAAIDAAKAVIYLVLPEFFSLKPSFTSQIRNHRDPAGLLSAQDLFPVLLLFSGRSNPHPSLQPQDHTTFQPASGACGFLRNYASDSILQ